jgi:hypothetical protein
MMVDRSHLPDLEALAKIYFEREATIFDLTIIQMDQLHLLGLTTARIDLNVSSNRSFYRVEMEGMVHVTHVYLTELGIELRALLRTKL